MYRFREYTLNQINNSEWWRVFLDGTIVATLVNKEEARRFIWLQYKDREEIDYIAEADLENLAKQEHKPSK
jgi:hypothetical protein